MRAPVVISKNATPLAALPTAVKPPPTYTVPSDPTVMAEILLLNPVELAVATGAPVVASTAAKLGAGKLLLAIEVKLPPRYTRDPETAMALTVLFGSGLKVVLTLPSLLIRAARLIVVPPIEVKAPPTYHPPDPSGTIALIAPSLSTVELARRRPLVALIIARFLTEKPAYEKLPPA